MPSLSPKKRSNIIFQAQHKLLLERPLVKFRRLQQEKLQMLNFFVLPLYIRAVGDGCASLTCTLLCLPVVVATLSSSSPFCPCLLYPAVVLLPQFLVYLLTLVALVSSWSCSSRMQLFYRHNLSYHDLLLNLCNIFWFWEEPRRQHSGTEETSTNST